MKLSKTIIITIGQRKGGVGKSTTTLNLAHVLAEQGYKVLVIDLDDQQNTTRSISAMVKSESNIEDLLLKEDISLTSVAVETSWPDVWILPSSSNLSGVVKQLDQELGSHLILKERLENDFFDFILIDTSPSLNILVVNALCASNYILIPLSSKFFSMQGLTQTLQAVKKVKTRLNKELKLLGIAFVNHDKRNVLANEVVDQIRDKYTDQVFKTMIGINIRIEEAQVKKESILTYAPQDRGSSQYREFGLEVLNRVLTN